MLHLLVIMFVGQDLGRRLAGLLVVVAPVKHGDHHVKSVLDLAQKSTNWFVQGVLVSNPMKRLSFWRILTSVGLWEACVTMDDAATHLVVLCVLVNPDSDSTIRYNQVNKFSTFLLK